MNKPFFIGMVAKKRGSLASITKLVYFYFYGVIKDISWKTSPWTSAMLHIFSGL